MTKQNSFTKKVFSLLLSLAMVLTMMPAAAFAADDIAVQASEYVAEVTIGDETTQYADINEAFKVVKDANDATIKLLRDTEIDNQYHDGGGVELKGSGRTTLDLNGKTLKQAQASSYASCGTVSTRETATLIIKDSAGGGRIQQINENPAVITNGNSTLIIESGTIETMNSDDKESYVCYLNCAVNLDDNSTVIINGGTLKGKRGVVEEVSSNGSLTITGGDISGTDGNALIVYGDSPATLSGGTFSTESNDHSIWVNQDGRTAKDLLAENYHYETSTGAESTYSDDGKGVKGNTIVKIPADKQVSYINADGVEAAQTNFTELSGGDYAIAITQGGWFAVRTDTAIKGLSISDEVNLILCDGATLTVSDTLTVAEGCKLNIYFQTNGTGKLTAATVSNTDQITAPAGAMKRTTDTNGTTFEKCLSHEWGETTSGSVFIKTCTLCGTVNKENAVAKLTTSGNAITYYTTLGEAFSAATAAENSTVQLLMDVQSTDDIKVTSGTFTIDLNGKKWEGTNQDMTSVLWVDGGNVTVTSTSGTGTINGYTDSTLVRNAIFVMTGTVHVKKGVRMNILGVNGDANLTLDTGVIITRKIWGGREGKLAPFLPGKALQCCDENGNTKGEYVSIYNNEASSSDCMVVIDHESCAGHVDDKGKCTICGKSCDHPDATENDNTCPDCQGKLIAALTLKGSKGSTVQKQLSTIEDGISYMGSNISIPDKDEERVDTFEIKLREKAEVTAANGGRFDFSNKHIGTALIFDLNGGIVNGSIYDKANTSGSITIRNGKVGSGTSAFEFSDLKVTLENVDADGGTWCYDDISVKSGSYKEFQVFDHAEVKLSGGTYQSLIITSKSGTDPQKSYADLLETGYIYTDPTTGAYIPASDMNENTAVKVVKCEHKKGDTSWFKNGKCQACSYVCDHQSVVIETGKCSDCGTQMAAKIGDSYFTTLAAAIEAAEDNGTVILLTNVEENITITDGMKVTIDLNEKTWKGSGTTWQAAVPLTVEGGSVTVKNGTLNQGGASSYANHAVIVNGGSLIVGEGMTIRGANVDGTNYRSAIKVESGELSLSKDTNLIFGMSVPEGKQLKDYLPTDTAFRQADHQYSGVGDYFDSESAQIINGYVQEKTGDFMLTVAEHTHFVGSNSKCACGFTCAHSSFSNGKCDICGYECTHPSDKVGESSGTATCGICNAQMVVKVTSSDNTTTYYAKHFESNGYTEDTLKQVFMNAESGSTVTLLADGLYASGWAEGKELTLNLNGKNVIENNGFAVDSKDGTAGKLIVTGSGSSTTPEDAYPGICTFRVWNGELLFDDNFSGTFKTIYVHGGTLTSVNESQSAIHIGTLDITNSGATISLKGGTFDEICFTGSWGSVKLGDLLANKNSIQKSVKAFKYTTGDKAFVPYNTEITNDKPVENVTITDCPHDSITEGKDSGSCGYCGMDNIAAILTDANGSIKTYTMSDGANIFSNWATNGGTLKLYSDLTFNDYLGTQGGTTEMVIDLNGHEISLPSGATDQEVTLNGGSLTITDSSSDKSGRFSATLRVYYTASLTVDGVAMGTIGLKSSTASITLKEGTTFTGYEKTSGTMLAQWIEDGNCISGLSNSIDAYTDKSESGSFAVVKAPAAFSTSVKHGTIRYNGLMPEEVIPGITLDAGSNVSSVEMRWYYSKGGSFYMMNQNGTIYPNAPEKTWRGKVNNYNVFDKFSIGDTISDVFCVLTASDGSWSTVLRGYSFTLANGDLSEATVNATNLDSLVYTTNENGSNVSQRLDFSVTHNGDWNTLTEGTDYQVKGNSSLAYNAGEYTLVLEGLGKYAGSTLEYEWNIAKRELTGIAKMTKTYDGTEALPEQITFAYNGGEVTLTRGGDYEATGGYYSAGAGTSKGANANITLKNTNYTFANNDATKEFSTSESISNAEITKAKAPSDIEKGTLNIFNNHAADYSYYVAEELLPKLDDSKQYGKVTYTSTWNGTDDSYKVTTSGIDELGQLSLRVEESNVNDEKQIGSFTITVKSENYEDFTLTVNVNAINKLTPTGSPTLSEKEITYGYSVNAISLSGDMKYDEATVTGKFEWINGNATPDAGPYEAEWKFTPDKDIYKEVTEKTTITVKEATLTGVSVQQTGALEYNGNAQTATVVTNATAVNGQTVTFTYSNSEDGTYSDTVPAFTDAGTYTVYYKAAAANHETVTGSFEVTIAAKKLTIKVTIKDKVYDGTDTAEIDTVTFDGLVGTDTVEYTASDVKFNNADVATADKVTGTITLNKDVKNYVLTDGNFTAKANISKADATCTAPTGKKDLVYNGNAQALITAGTAVGGTLVYSTEENGTYDEKIPTGKDVGTYTVWYKVVGDENHNNTKPASVSVTISQKDITNAEITLGDTLTYNGTEQTQSVALVKIDGLDVTYTVSSNIGMDAKDYTLTVTGTGNFIGTKTAKWSIAKKDITKADITLGTALEYNGKEQTQNVASVKIDGLNATYDVTGNTGKDAGQYELTVAGTGNFTGTATAKFTIAKATVTTTDKPTQNSIYAGAEVSAVTFKTNETSKKNEVTVNFNGNEVKLEGTWSITEAKDAEGNDITKFEKTGKYTCTATFTPEDPNFAPIIIDGIEITVTSRPSGGGAVIPASEVTTDKTGNADEKATTSPAEVKTETKTGADGSTETISKVTVSDANQKEIIKQVKDNKSEEIIIKVSDKDVKDGAKLEIDLDKDFVDSIITDTDAKLTIKTPAGDKTFTQEELKKLSESAEGGVITIASSVFEEPTEPAEPSGMLTPAQEKIVKGVKATTITLKSVRTKSGKIRLTWTKSKGYKVDYFEVYRSVKKNSGYGKKPFFTTKSGDISKYLNTKNLKAGKTYYYKVRGVRVINGKKYYTEYSNKTWKKAK